MGKERKKRKKKRKCNELKRNTNVREEEKRRESRI